MNIQVHTYTHQYRERERERKKKLQNHSLILICFNIISLSQFWGFMQRPPAPRCPAPPAAAATAPATAGHSAPKSKVHATAPIKSAHTMLLCGGCGCGRGNSSMT